MRIRFLLFLFFISSAHAYQTDAIVPPVVISANKHLNQISTHAPKTIITHDDMTHIGATSLSQALQELGGVQLQDTTGNSSQVALSMRGFGVNASSNTLLLINGIPITNPDLAPPDLNAIPIQEIEYIEITSGTETVLYGDQAVAGTINIVTHKETKKTATLSCGGGSYNSHNCYAHVNTHISQLKMSLGALTSYSDNYRQHNEYDHHLLSGTLDYPYRRGNTSIDYQIAKEHMLYPGALTAQQVRQNRRLTSNNIDFFRDWNGFYHLKNKQYLTNNWRIETDLARRDMHGNGVLTVPFHQSRITNFIKPQLKGKIGNIVSTSGIDFENDDYHLDSMYGITDDSQQKYGLFSLVNIPLYQYFSLSLGARGAQQNNHLVNPQITNSINRAIASTLGITYQPNSNLQFYLRRAENFRFPKADEDASSDANGLKTQRGVSYETGSEWRFKQTYSKLGLFQLNLRDEITFDPTQTPLQPFGSNRNLAPTVRRGITFSEKYLATQQLTLDGQYNYVRARFQNGINTGKRIPLVSENIFHGGVNYAITSRWNLYSEAVYTGSQFAANDNANIAGELGGYIVYNFNLRYQFKELSAALRFNNIFNKYYYFYAAYQNSINTEYYYPAPGRNFLLTLTANLG
jgi:iron complex outermembrane receptor protein